MFVCARERTRNGVKKKERERRVCFYAWVGGELETLAKAVLFLVLFCI